MECAKIEVMGDILLKLGGDLDVHEAAAARDEILSGLKEHQGLHLDLKDVSACDLAGIQLLGATFKSAQQQEKEFSIIAVSPAVEQALARAGLRLDDFSPDGEILDDEV